MPKIAFKFDIHDLWVGVYWKRADRLFPSSNWRENMLKLYVIVVPCFVMIVTLEWNKEIR